VGYIADESIREVSVFFFFFFFFQISECECRLLPKRAEVLPLSRRREEVSLLVMRPIGRSDGKFQRLLGVP
jgi:hypothetical protein